MTKLTKSIREQMARKLVLHRYKAKAATFTTTNRLLFERIYKFMYDTKTRAAMDALLAINPNALPTTSQFSVNVGMRYDIDATIRLRVRSVGTLAEGAKVDPVHVLNCDANYNSRINIPDGDKRDPKLHEDIKTYAQDRMKFQEECDTAYCEALAALESFTTGKKLAEGWPEAMPVIGDLIPEGCRTLPMVQVSDLNHKFELPPETA